MIPSFATAVQDRSDASSVDRLVATRSRDVWEIGVMPWYETYPPRIHGVLVDAVTGTIRGPLDRPWDQDVDPFP